MDNIRLNAERGGYTPPEQVAKLVAIIDEYGRTDLLTRADECDSLADIMGYTVSGTLSADFLRRRAQAYRERLDSLDQRSDTQKD